MTEVQLREFLLTALRDANVFGLDEPSLCSSFVSGESDIALDALDMDSLAAMEVCIALESATGVSITPRDMALLGSLGALIARLRAGAP
jgi:acyl carrier protein